MDSQVIPSQRGGCCYFSTISERVALLGASKRIGIELQCSVLQVEDDDLFRPPYLRLFACMGAHMQARWLGPRVVVGGKEMSPDERTLKWHIEFISSTTTSFINASMTHNIGLEPTMKVLIIFHP